MADQSLQFSIPEVYDSHLGPVMFDPYAENLARRLSGQVEGAVLEVACGTGILTRQSRKKGRQGVNFGLER